MSSYRTSFAFTLFLGLFLALFAITTYAQVDISANDECEGVKEQFTCPVGNKTKSGKPCLLGAQCKSDKVNVSGKCGAPKDNEKTLDGQKVKGNCIGIVPKAKGALPAGKAPSATDLGKTGDTDTSPANTTQTQAQRIEELNGELKSLRDYRDQITSSEERQQNMRQIQDVERQIAALANEPAPESKNLLGKISENLVNWWNSAKDAVAIAPPESPGHGIVAPQGGEEGGPPVSNNTFAQNTPSVPETRTQTWDEWLYEHSWGVLGTAPMPEPTLPGDQNMANGFGEAPAGDVADFENSLKSNRPIVGAEDDLLDSKNAQRVFFNDDGQRVFIGDENMPRQPQEGDVWVKDDKTVVQYEESPAPEPTWKGGESAYLADQRAELMAELDPDVGAIDDKTGYPLRDLVKAVIIKEIGTQDGVQAVLESMVNRSILKGYDSLSDAIHSGFYGPVNTGAVQALLRSGMNETILAMGDRAIEAVAAGSNICSMCTEQGEAWEVPGKKWNIGGEYFGHVSGNPSWAQGQATAMAQYDAANPAVVGDWTPAPVAVADVSYTPAQESAPSSPAVASLEGGSEAVVSEPRVAQANSLGNIQGFTKWLGERLEGIQSGFERASETVQSVIAHPFDTATRAAVATYNGVGDAVLSIGSSISSSLGFGGEVATPEFDNRFEYFANASPSEINEFSTESLESVRADILEAHRDTAPRSPAELDELQRSQENIEDVLAARRASPADNDGQGPNKEALANRKEAPQDLPLGPSREARSPQETDNFFTRTLNAWKGAYEYLSGGLGLTSESEAPSTRDENMGAGFGEAPAEDVRDFENTLKSNRPVVGPEDDLLKDSPQVAPRVVRGGEDDLLTDSAKVTTQPNSNDLLKYKELSIREALSRTQYETGEKVGLYNAQNQQYVENVRTQLADMEDRFPCLKTGDCEAGSSQVRPEAYRQSVAETPWSMDEKMKIHDTAQLGRNPPDDAGGPIVRAGFSWWNPSTWSVPSWLSGIWQGAPAVDDFGGIGASSQSPSSADENMVGGFSDATPDQKREFENSLANNEAFDKAVERVAENKGPGPAYDFTKEGPQAAAGKEPRQAIEGEIGPGSGPAAKLPISSGGSIAKQGVDALPSILTGDGGAVAGLKIREEALAGAIRDVLADNPEYAKTLLGQEVVSYRNGEDLRFPASGELNMKDVFGNKEFTDDLGKKIVGAYPSLAKQLGGEAGVGQFTEHIRNAYTPQSAPNEEKMAPLVSELAGGKNVMAGTLGKTWDIAKSIGTSLWSVANSSFEFVSGGFSTGQVQTETSESAPSGRAEEASKAAGGNENESASTKAGEPASQADEKGTPESDKEASANAEAEEKAAREEVAQKEATEKEAARRVAEEKAAAQKAAETKAKQNDPQTVKARNALSQLAGLQSRYNSFIANPTEQKLNALASQARAVQGLARSFPGDPTLVGLANQLGGISQAAGYSPDLAAGALRGYSGQINGGIQTARARLSTYIKR